MQPTSDFPELNVKYVILVSVIASVSPFLFGYDLNVINVILIFALKNKHLDLESSLWHGLVVAATPAFAGIGSITTAPLSDRFGRKRVIVYSTVVYIVAGILSACSFNRIMLVIARAINGCYIGIVCMLVPLYLGECSPARIRGRLLSLFQLSGNVGGVLANLIGAAVTPLDPANVSWRILFALPCVIAAVQLVIFVLLLPESPSWVYQHQSSEKAVGILKRIYGKDTAGIETGIQEIEAEIKEKSQIKGSLKQIVATKHVFKAFLLGCMLQLLNLASGASSVQFFIGSTVKSIGITDDLTAIWISLATTTAAAVFGFVPFFTIDRFGRRPVLIISQILVVVSLLGLAAAYWQVAATSGAVIAAPFIASSSSSQCSTYTNCASCIRDTNCNFCGPTGISSSAPGYCLSIVGNTTTCQGPADQAMWSFYDGYCYTSISWVPLIGVIAFLATYAAGLSSLPWTLNAEFYPLWARSTCVSVTTAMNWWTNLVISFTFLILVNAITIQGSYLLYAIITACGAVFCFFVVPETNGLQLDEIQRLFMSKEARSRIGSNHRSTGDLHVDETGNK